MISCLNYLTFYEGNRGTYGIVIISRTVNWRLPSLIWQRVLFKHLLDISMIDIKYNIIIKMTDIIYHIIVIINSEGSYSATL